MGLGLPIHIYFYRLRRVMQARFGQTRPQSAAKTITLPRKLIRLAGQQRQAEPYLRWPRAWHHHP